MQHHLPITKTARYFTSQAPGTHIKQVWVVVHGYGQLAEFSCGSSTLVRREYSWWPQKLAPLLPRRLQRPGRGQLDDQEDRLSDIADYVGFLNDLHSHIAAQVGEAQWQVVGFSQGAATAARWLSQTQADIHQFIVWAALSPTMSISKPVVSA